MFLIAWRSEILFPLAAASTIDRFVALIPTAVRMLGRRALLGNMTLDAGWTVAIALAKSFFRVTDERTVVLPHWPSTRPSFRAEITTATG